MKIEIKTNFELNRTSEAVSDSENLVELRKQDMNRYLTPESVETVVETVDEVFHTEYDGKYFLKDSAVDVCMERDLEIPKSFVLYDVIRNYVYSVYQLRMAKNYLIDERNKTKGFDGD